MPVLSTNDSNGLGFQTNEFTLPTGVNVSAAFANRLHTDPYYKAAYNCNIIGDCNISTWLDEFGGTEFDCHPTYTLLEYNGFRTQIKVDEDTTIPSSATNGTITLSTTDHSVAGAYYLPAVGNTLVLPPSGVLAEVISIAHSGANTTVLTVKQRGSSSIALTAGMQIMVVPGQIVSDCECPVGQFRVPELPIEHDISMIEVTDGGQLCGDDLESCQYFSIPFLDAQGNVIGDKSPWYTIGEQEMYRGLEKKKYIERLLNPTFGVIPTIKARGMKFTPASNSEITLADIRALKKELRVAGVTNMEWSIFAGTDKFSQWQQFLGNQGVSQLNYMERPLSGCSWINMQYCGIMIEGLTLHIYEDCSFGNGKGLGAAGMVFPNSSIWVPMGDRPMSSKYDFGTPNRNGDMNNKMFTTVYFQGINGGRKYDLMIDSNGILGPRNSFGTGCRKQEWAVRSKFSFEVHCPQAWIYDGL